MSTSHSVGNNSVKENPTWLPTQSWLQQPGLHLQSGGGASQSLLCGQVEAHPQLGVKEKGPPLDSVSTVLWPNPEQLSTLLQAPGWMQDAGVKRAIVSNLGRQHLEACV